MRGYSTDLELAAEVNVSSAVPILDQLNEQAPRRRPAIFLGYPKNPRHYDRRTSGLDLTANPVVSILSGPLGTGNDHVSVPWGQRSTGAWLGNDRGPRNAVYRPSRGR